jgi:hypothetical protein
MSRILETFENGVLACVDDINRILPRLHRRYGAMVIAYALAEHVGGALQLLMRRKLFDAAQARQVVSRIEVAAFTKKSTDPDGTRPKNAAPH